MQSSAWFQQPATRFRIASPPRKPDQTCSWYSILSWFPKAYEQWHRKVIDQAIRIAPLCRSTWSVPLYAVMIKDDQCSAWTLASATIFIRSLRAFRTSLSSLPAVPTRATLSMSLRSPFSAELALSAGKRRWGCTVVTSCAFSCPLTTIAMSASSVAALVDAMPKSKLSIVHGGMCVSARLLQSLPRESAPIDCIFLRLAADKGRSDRNLRWCSSSTSDRGL